jgi:hypothetical protein
VADLTSSRAELTSGAPCRSLRLRLSGSCPFWSLAGSAAGACIVTIFVGARTKLPALSSFGQASPRVLVIRGPARPLLVWRAKPLKPRRDVGVIQVRAIAAAGADELMHVGIEAFGMAVHDAGRLAPQERRVAVVRLTGERGVMTSSGPMPATESRRSWRRGAQTAAGQAAGPVWVTVSRASGPLTPLTLRR